MTNPIIQQLYYSTEMNQDKSETLSKIFTYTPEDVSPNEMPNNCKYLGMLTVETTKEVSKERIPQYISYAKVDKSFEIKLRENIVSEVKSINFLSLNGLFFESTHFRITPHYTNGSLDRFEFIDLAKKPTSAKRPDSPRYPKSFFNKNVTSTLNAIPEFFT